VRLAAASIALALALAPAALGQGHRAFAKLGPGCARADVRSGGAVVPAELCRRGDEHAAVVVLHGCGGFNTLDHQLAADLPDHGIATLYLDYFAPTPPAGGKGFCGGPRRPGLDPFPVWTQEVRDAAAALRHTPGIDANEVGVVGWSLGGGVALGAALSGGKPFDAIALFSSFAHGLDPQTARELPPTLVLSGGSHDAVPVSEAIALHDALVAAHVPTQLHVYPNGVHQWPGAQGRAGLAWTIAFLRRYL
jgi:dienelactone hydrolase